jgi:MoaA/NifB/PqqE/SkfB family radical SAM enzyme
VNSRDIFRAWGRVLSGRRPSLSIEITRECPLRCPGCYAYEDGHVGEGMNLRELADKKGDDLIQGVLEVVDKYRPLHLSLVGGDPLVRFRELETLLPLLQKRGLHIQLVTSAFREIPKAWAELDRLNIVVSIDGLQPEHDERRKPATYERILRNIQGHRVTIHCTITAQMMQRAGYLDEFLSFWTPKDEIKRVWMSFFTPQVGATGPEILSRQQRSQAVQELLRLREFYPKLDMAAAVIREFLNPPASPEKCVFAQTTLVLSADLKTRVAPCQFGGSPDCSQCGCIASMGLAAVGHHRLPAGIALDSIMKASMRLGKIVKKITGAAEPEVPPQPTFNIIS